RATSGASRGSGRRPSSAQGRTQGTKTVARVKTVRSTEQVKPQAAEQDEAEILRRGIETCRTKQEFHNFLAKNLENKDHILKLYNQGKKQLDVDIEAVRRENADPGQDA
ncbi:MAG: hypothetical protein IKX54_02055, partial [Lachnospiraceae bacterium]|nr:hypothetical protein [Lachnospiraceae bacterium]